MSDEILRQLAEEIAKQTIINSWPLYLLLITFTFLGVTFGSYLKGRFTKQGEIAATKADAEIILEQLKEATTATKNVELSLSRMDWIQRERNALQRTKLEQLLVAALSIESWTYDSMLKTVDGKDIESNAPIEEFEMLSTLYFPELSVQTNRVHASYLRARIAMIPIHSKLYEWEKNWELAMRNPNAKDIDRLVDARMKYQREKIPIASELYFEVMTAVRDLSNAARGLMEQLTSPNTHL